VRPLTAATGVWIDGGDGSGLIARYIGTRVERELTAVLTRGGVIGGTSAGALIWGSQSLLFRARPGAPRSYVPTAADLLIPDVHEAAFGLLSNVCIVPHFAEFRMQAALEKRLAAQPGLLGIGIDEATALEVHGDVGRVLGRGNVTIYDGRAHGGRAYLVLGEGARYDLHRRIAL
jgi:cyanophycinase